MNKTYFWLNLFLKKLKKKILINVREPPVLAEQTFSDPNAFNLVDMVSTKVS